ncbi:DUF5667 domain-containing protein [Streptomyces iconiensis]|uniref:DUF5667 domain-containing protein n=1 Tax=Streptomyces iconiensis TaxID=1384038 RepID=A0ABT6ZXP7_9ACTN|nr:DUF5667 domain-containing protein [Streptomyces iconiensis]MDJ1133849.1 DUF5667 domain-containing protein [Streptomyces iconiensis]
MIGSVSTSRRAIAFAQALDERELDEGTAADKAPPDTAGGSGGAPPGQSTERTERSLLSLADELEALPRPELDPEVKTVQRAQLIAAMEAAFAEGESGAEGAHFPEQRDARARSRLGGGGGSHRATGLGPLSKLRPKSRLGKGLAAGGLSVGVAASAFGGVAAASTDALPGDSLYGLKRGMEDLKLDMAGDDADRGSLFLDHASTRMQEARRLMERDRAGLLDHESLAEVRRALAGMRHDASEGHRLLSEAYRQDGDIGRMQSLSSFSKSHRAGWAQLRDRLPNQLTDVGDEVSSVFDAIDSDVGPLRSLFPREQEGEAAPHRSPETSDRTGEEEPSAEPSAPSSDGMEGQRDGASEKPEPSEPQEKNEGLLGGDLFDPSQEPHDERQPSGPDSEKDGSSGGPSSSGGKPEVTLPPIVPDVLPGLGLDDGDKK